MSKLNCTDFYKRTTYNVETLNQIWMSQIADSHDIWCNCSGPFSHLLASIFPPGHSDRNKTIDEILLRDFKEQCRGGGTVEESHGLADGEEKRRDIKEEDFQDADIEELILAAAAAEEKER
nr:ORF2 [Torque teno midi virus]